MAGSINKALIVGNVGRDPEIRNTQSGEKIATLSVATSESWKDKASGERKEKTEWHRVVVFNDRLADFVQQYVKKGSKVYVEGALQTRKWEKDGVERFATEIVLTKFRGEIQLLDSRKVDESADEAPAKAAPKAGKDFDDDIPF